MNVHKQQPLVSVPTQAHAAHLNQVAKDVINSAQNKGADAVEVGLSTDAGVTLSVRQRVLETLEHHRDTSLSMTVYFGQTKGHVSISDLTPAAINEAIDYACTIAQFTQPDPYAGLADPELMAHQYPELELFSPWDLTFEQAEKIAIECESAALDADPRIVNSEGATVATYTGYHVYANSHGFLGGYWTSKHSLSCSVVGQSNDEMQRDYDYTVSRFADQLISAQEIGRITAQKTLARLSARQIPTQRVPVIFHHECAGSLFSHFFSAIRGSSQYRQASYLLGQMGQSVMPEHITIKEYPHILHALASSPFDSEGVKTVDRTWVDAGVLQSYILSSYSARKLGMTTTGNAGGIHNIRLSTSDDDLAGLMKKMQRGLLVTELIGHGVNIVTGDYSRGAVGYWIENGEIQFPVHEITIAGNLRDMLRNIVAIGNDLEKRSAIWTGSVLIDGMTVAGG